MQPLTYSRFVLKRGEEQLREALQLADCAVARHYGVVRSDSVSHLLAMPCEVIVEHLAMRLDSEEVLALLATCKYMRDTLQNCEYLWYRIIEQSDVSTRTMWDYWKQSPARYVFERTAMSEGHFDLFETYTQPVYPLSDLDRWICNELNVSTSRDVGDFLYPRKKMLQQLKDDCKLSGDEKSKRFHSVDFWRECGDLPPWIVDSTICSSLYLLLRGKRSSLLYFATPEGIERKLATALALLSPLRGNFGYRDWPACIVNSVEHGLINIIVSVGNTFESTLCERWFACTRDSCSISLLKKPNNIVFEDRLYSHRVHSFSPVRRLWRTTLRLYRHSFSHWHLLLSTFFGLDIPLLNIPLPADGKFRADDSMCFVSLTRAYAFDDCHFSIIVNRWQDSRSVDLTWKACGKSMSD